MRVNALLRLYPPAWRARYGDEMQAVLEERPLGRRDRLDLLRGAIDAWLHPRTPSVVPILAAFAGGGLWTVAAIAVLAHPVPLDWPGYLLEIVPFALVGAVCQLATVGSCLLRVVDLSGRVFGAIAGSIVIGYVAWVVALAGTIAGAIGGAPLAAAQAAAMVATIAVGLPLLRGQQGSVGVLLIVAAVAMLVPWTATWLAFGVAWTALGVVLLVDRSVRLGRSDLEGPANG